MLLCGGRVVDPAARVDRAADIWIVDGKIAAIEPNFEPPAEASAYRRVDVAGCIIGPGLIDLTAEFRQPGKDADETIATGSAAAAAGGYTTVLCASSTSPVIDSAAAVELVKQLADRVGGVRVLPIACVSAGRAGEQMAELGTLAAAGAVAFSDSPRPLANDALLKTALDYCRMLDRPIFDRPQVPSLAGSGVMHEGRQSLQLGLKGLPTEAEDLAVARDLRLAEATGGRLHLGPVSTMGAIDMIGRVRDRNADGKIRVTSSVCPHNLIGDDSAMRSFESRFKVHPPMRSPGHVAALRRAVADGVIDAIESGHMPRATEKKAHDLDIAPFGGATLEAVLAVLATDLVAPGILSWSRLLHCLSTAPAAIAGVPGGSLAVGSAADVVVIDPQNEWTIDASRFQSRCRSSPFDGLQATARVRMTIVGGGVVYSLGG